jgi:hypothetical protein
MRPPGEQASSTGRPAEVPLRAPHEVLNLTRMGAAHQSRLSFLRALLRDVKRSGWTFARPLWEIDARGFGQAVYSAAGSGHTYSLVCFSQELAPEKRTDRVIAEEWDASFVLYDGLPSLAEIERLRHAVPRQEAGRYRETDLVLSRANRSVRLFARVVEALAAGAQPVAAEVEVVGYLMRTTAVYGNGKFGIADRDVIAGRPILDGPFRAEMLTVWLIRAFTVDLVEHMAREQAPATAVALAPALRRRFGVGNATGLGMAPFLVRHAALIHGWVLARERALARVRALPSASLEEQLVFARTLGRAKDGLNYWLTDDLRQSQAIAGLAVDIDRLSEGVMAGALDQACPWEKLYRWATNALSLEGQELCLSLMLEPHGPLVDDLAGTMAADEGVSFPISGAMTCGDLKSLIECNYPWALGRNYRDAREQARFWYTSVEKLEPRLGERFEEAGGEREQPLGVGRDVDSLHAALTTIEAAETVGQFLAREPGHRHAVRRVQINATHPYSEIRENLLSADMRPVDILRYKLAMFGATRFDPRSDRWLRITLCQGAPFPHELATSPTDDWILFPCGVKR